MPRKSTGASSAAAPPTSPTTATAPGDTSILSTTTAEPKSPTSKRGKQSEDVGIDDLLLPRSLTSRLARGILPPNTSLGKDAVLALTKSATVFISYLASHANELTSRKTIQSADVLKALEEIELAGVMGLGEVSEDGRVGGRLERELQLWEEGVRGKRKGYREKVKARESGVSENGKDGERDEEGEPRQKRIRRESEEDEEGLLAAQLNGEPAKTGLEVDGDGKDEDEEANGHSPEEERDNDETEDDPDVEDELSEPDVEEDDEQEQVNRSADEDRVDVEESPQKKGRYVLAPDGRAEVENEDESD